MRTFKELEIQMRAAPLVGYEQVKEIKSTSGIYIAWLEEGEQCLYVGSAGKRVKGNLQNRIRAHFRGARGSDQFCLYVYDTYLHDQRCRLNTSLETKEIDKCTGKWIQNNVKFRCLPLGKDQLKESEDDFRREWRPKLNPLS